MRFGVDVRLGDVIPNVEAAVFGPFLADGYTVIVPDTEGQRADFAAGPEYGMNTLDSIRAAFNSSTVPNNARVAMLGYSGGAIATEWAAELAPTYAPDANKHLIGAAIGGVLVDPAHNLHYVEGTGFWAGVMAMALVGIARGFEIETELAQYLSPNGARIFHQMQTASIINVLGQYPGLKWRDLVSPDYPTPEDLALYVRCANKLIMGTGGTPTIPLFIGQGANGALEGTPGNKKDIGAGDGVMIAGDVRTLARDYCAKGAHRLLRGVRRAQPHLECPHLVAQRDRVDQTAIRRPAGSAELFVNPGRELTRADSRSARTQLCWLKPTADYAGTGG